MDNKALVRGAFLIAVAVVLQAIRLVLPLPPVAGAFVIGSLVNMMLAVTVWVNGIKTALLLGCLLPVFAYAQGQLLLPVLIPVVMLGNGLYAAFVQKLKGSKAMYIVPAVLKAVVMCGAAYAALAFLGIDKPAVRSAILFAMSVPQLVTGVIGVVLASRLVKIIHNKIE